MKRQLAIGTVAVLTMGGALGCGSLESASSGSNNDKLRTTDEAEQALLGGKAALAEAKDATGNVVARVVFAQKGAHTTLVAVAASLPPGESIHGFHVHANDNPANGVGCIADPAQPAATHFVSADGHYNPGGGIHGAHAGDMPALFVAEDGSAVMTFTTDRFVPADIIDRAVIVHASPDNYGNIPVGAAANQYTPNSAEATTLTNNTGNAGVRIACGVIK